MAVKTCFFCNKKFGTEEKDKKVHVKKYDIDVCGGCMKVSKERWNKMTVELDKKLKIERGDEPEFVPE